MTPITETDQAGTKARKGRPRRAGLDAEILAAAVRLIAERGYGGTTIDNVAREAGVAKTTLYRRWPSKGELGMDALATALGAPPADLPRGQEGLRAAIDWLAVGVRRRGVQRLLVGLIAEAAEDPSMRALLRARMREPFTRRLADEWGLPEARVDLAFDTVVGTLLHRLAMTGRIDPSDAREVAGLATRLLFEPE